MRSKTGTDRWWLAPLLMVFFGVLAYHNSFSGVLLLDDQQGIVENPALHSLWPLGPLLSSTSRPLVNLTLALNYQWSRLDVGSYHAVNLAIHLLAAGVLYGLLWRLLRSKGLGLAVAVVWVVHPLTTQAVTYVIQRAESLMGLWYLLTLYGLVRATPGDGSCRHHARWQLLSICACWLGMATKPVMVTAPLLALLLDRTFLAGSFRQAWRLRKSYYLFLFASWGLLALILSQPHESLQTTGFEGNVPTAWEYARTQPAVILHYLRLAIWPHPLTIDYLWPVARTASDMFLPAVGLVAALAGCASLWRRNPALGFWAWWVFMLLAPTSTVIPIADLAAEHRMYLPLIGVITCIVIAVSSRLPRVIAVVLLATAVLAGTAATIRRNADYHDRVAIWRDTVAKRPDNPRAHNVLGFALAEQGRFDEAAQAFQEALRLFPNFSGAHNNLGNVLLQQGHVSDAVAHYTRALELQPDSAETHTGLGLALAAQGKLEEAIAHYRHAIALDPQAARAYNNLAAALADQGRVEDALANYARALELLPHEPRIHYNMSQALMARGHIPQAIAHLETALRLNPDDAEARAQLQRLQTR